MTLAHAKLSASGSKRWLSCSASVQAEAGLTESGSNIYADEGTAAHELGERCLREGKMASHFIGESIIAGDHTFEVDEDMASAVQVYVDYCNNLPVEVRLLEKRVRFDKWVRDGFGTSDFIGIGKFSKMAPDRKVIYVVDLKFGKGIMVDALDNSQAMLYGLGVIQTLNFVYDFKENDQIVCVIVQPRLDHISEFTITVGDLLRWADNTVVPAVADALGDNPTYNPGDEQCRWCKAKGSCKALAEENLKVVARDFSVIGEEFEVKDRAKLTPAEVGSIMQKLKGIYDWGKAVEAHGFNLKMSGTHVPGFKIVKGKAKNKIWNEDEDTVSIQLGSMRYFEGGEEFRLTHMDYMKTSIRTPTQMIKILKSKGMDEKQIDLFWDQPEGGLTIAPEADKRKEIILKSSVESDFGAIK